MTTLEKASYWLVSLICQPQQFCSWMVNYTRPGTEWRPVSCIDTIKADVNVIRRVVKKKGVSVELARGEARLFRNLSLVNKKVIPKTRNTDQPTGDLLKNGPSSVIRTLNQRTLSSGDLPEDAEFPVTLEIFFWATSLLQLLLFLVTRLSVSQERGDIVYTHCVPVAVMLMARRELTFQVWP